MGEPRLDGRLTAQMEGCAVLVRLEFPHGYFLSLPHLIDSTEAEVTAMGHGGVIKEREEAIGAALWLAATSLNRIAPRGRC